MWVFLSLFFTTIFGTQLCVKEYFDGEELHQNGPYLLEISGKRIESLVAQACPELSSKKVIPFLMPPLVDAHVHAGFFDRGFSKNLKENLRFNFFRKKEDQYDLSLSFLNDMKNKGFLYLRDLGGHRKSRKTFESIYKEVGNFKDKLPYLNWVAIPFSWGMGQCLEGFPCGEAFQDISQKSKDEVLKEIKKQKAIGFHTIKVYLDNNPVVGDPMPREWAIFFIKESQALGMKVAFHVMEPLSYLGDLTEYQNVSLEHLNSLGISSLQINATLVPTAISVNLVSYLQQRAETALSFYYERKKISKVLANLIKEKKDLCFGSDFYTVTNDPVRGFGFWALDHLIEYYRLGMKTEEVLKMAGINCRNVFTVNKPSLIKGGKKANLLFLTGSPFKDILNLHNIHSLYKEGVRIK